ncbi:2'-5' RNA ligase family protein [Alicyclobacillus fodiniaquatilis]|uniref:2'-5' RNA ligase family protein n=1 Tax=Alicyclobacillus fodiniaquatilis TaxID=1661150 RepID=A0ABW4JDD9_9BACL
MQFFIGIVPPHDYKQKIIEFQKKWVNNNMWKIVEPHITVKAQGGLGTDLAWLDSIKQVCASFPKFPVSLGQPETFDVAVAYLSVHSDQLRDFHEKLVSAVSPPPEIMKRYMEMDRFIPHLTLGQTHWGLNSEEIVDMKVSALMELAPFPTFTVDFVRVYRQIEKDNYTAYEDIELA